MLPILLLLIATLIAIGITNAAGNTAEPETEQTFTEEGDGYYIWVRAVDHAGNKGPWSEAQRVWIETGLPTITIKTNSNTTWAQTGSVTVALQDSKSGLAEGASVKYGWSESLDTEPSDYTDASLSYTAGTKEEVTFTAEASGLTGKYYLWVVPTTLADTAGNTQTTTAKSTGQFYFDNKGPSAPTISGGSTSWATSRTIKVDTDSTDEGIGTIANYEYYLASNSTAPTASTGATASLGSGVKSKVFNDQNYNGYYVYFRAVDSLGNAGTWSSAQRLYVDTVSPTVTANNASITIDEGTSNTFDSLFTVTWGGITTGTTAYTLNDASTSYTNTNELAAGTYTLKCIANKNNVTSANASVTITVKAKVTLPTETTYLYESSNSSLNNPTITVPDGVYVLALHTENRNMQAALNYSAILYNGTTVCACLYNALNTTYVSVTPGKTYTFSPQIQVNGPGYAVASISYSQQINQQTPSYNLDEL